MSLGKPAIRTWLALILVASCGLKLAILWSTGDIAPVLDEAQYIIAGESVAEGDGIAYTLQRWHPTGQGPLYPWFLGGIFWLGGGPFESKVVQILLSTATVWFVYLLGARWFNPRTGLITAALLAFYPTLIAFSHYNWSETLYTFWFALATLLLFDRAGVIASPRRLFVAGVVLGFTALTRAMFVYLVPLIVPWLHIGSSSLGLTFRRATMFVAGFALAIFPLTLHYYQKYDGVLLISSGSARVWNEAYNVYPPRSSDYGYPGRLRTYGRLPRQPVSEENQVIRVRKERRLGLQFMRRNPGLCFKRFLFRLSQYLNPTSFLIRHIRRGYYLKGPFRERYEPLPDIARESLVILTVASYLALMVAALLGMFAIPAGAARAYILLVLGFFLLLHGMTFGMSRYRLGLLPVLGVAAGFAWSHLPDTFRRLRSPWRAAAFLLVLAALCYAWSVPWRFIWLPRG